MTDLATVGRVELAPVGLRPEDAARVATYSRPSLATAP